MKGTEREHARILQVNFNHLERKKKQQQETTKTLI